MKLYRGYKERPKFLTPKMEEELQSLEARKKEFEKERLSLMEMVNRIGAENMIRLVELRRIAGPQFFTDDENVAREFATEKGYVIAIEVPDEDVMKHHEGVQLMVPAGIQRYVSNFVFTGRELSHHVDDWRVNLIELEREGTELEREDEPSKDVIHSPFRTIRQLSDLSDKDKAAISELRAKFKDTEGGIKSSHTPTEGKPPVS